MSSISSEDQAPTPPANARLFLQGASLAAGAVALVQALGGWDAEAVVGRLPGLCVYHQLTGHDCPGCGMTRAFLRLLHGDWSGAWRWHPFSLPLAVAFLVMAWAPGTWMAKAQRSPWSKVAAALSLALLLAWWLKTKVLPWL